MGHGRVAGLPTARLAGASATCTDLVLEHLVRSVYDLVGGLGAQEGDQVVRVGASAATAQQVGEAARALPGGGGRGEGPRVERGAAEVHGAVEQAARRGRQRVVVHGRAARAVAHQRHAAGVAAELADVVAHPAQRRRLVLQPRVAGDLLRAGRQEP